MNERSLYDIMDHVLNYQMSLEQYRIHYHWESDMFFSILDYKEDFRNTIVNYLEENDLDSALEYAYNFEQWFCYEYPDEESADAEWEIFFCK